MFVILLGYELAFPYGHFTMVTCCCVPGCHAREPGHRFPANSERRKKWLIAIRRENFTPTAESRVCKSHFVPEDYELPKDSVSANRKCQS